MDAQRPTLLWAGRYTAQEEAECAIHHKIPLPDEIQRIAHISAGHDHVLLIDQEGRLYVWGALPNLFGLKELKNTSQPKDKVFHINAFEGQRIIDCSTGLSSSLALTEQGKVYFWGMETGLYHAMGKTRQLDDIYTITSIDHPMLLSSPEFDAIKFVRVISGSSVEVALTDTNILYRFSSNEHDAVQLPEDMQVVQLAVDAQIILIRTASAQVYMLSPEENKPVLANPDIKEPAVMINGRGSGGYMLYGLPQWNKETHKHYPLEFRRSVKTLLLMTVTDHNNKPKYPQALVNTLPRELVFIIIEFLAATLGGTTTRMFLRHKEFPTSESILEVVGGSGYSFLLTASGKIQGKGDSCYDAVGTLDKEREGVAEGFHPVTSLEGVAVKHIYCGNYWTIVELI